MNGKQLERWTQDVHEGDAKEVLAEMPSNSIHMAMTSPPYFGLRDYGVDGQIGLEDSLDEYIQDLVDVADELQRVLRDDGSLWLNLGDSYAGSWGAQSHDREQNPEAKGHPDKNPARNADVPDKNRLLIPQRVAVALQDNGWIVRHVVPWVKDALDSAGDRLRRGPEQLLHLTVTQDYYADNEVLNRRGWFDFPQPNTGTDHPAVFPEELPRIPIRGTCPPDGIVLDPFAGSGTTLKVAKELGRRFVGIELNPEYVAMAQKRVGVTVDNPGLLLEENETALSAFADGGGPSE